MYKRILAIDGGGIKGVFPASFLASIENSIGDKISNYFDLIVGTSTGGIIALGLGLGMTSQDILSFYEKLGPKIFKGSFFAKLFKWVLISKYSQSLLREALNDTFKKSRLGDSFKRLVIPSLNLETGEVHLYKTSHHPRFEKDYKELAIDVALATASAPSYFPTFRSNSGIPLIDGGMWANNPISVAVVEALGILKWSSDFIKILSLGCTTEPLSVALGTKYSLGLSYWVTKVTDVFMTAQSSASLSMAQVLIGKTNIFRISPNVAKGRFSLDSIKGIQSLKGLGASEARKALPELRDNFFDKHADHFEPYYKLLKKQKKEI